MGDVLNKVDSFIGDVTGYNAQQRANSASASAADRLNQASDMNRSQTDIINKQRQANEEQAAGYNRGAQESLGANAADTMRLAQEAASKQAVEQANQAGGQAAAGARAAGLNAGQAAQMASQGTSNTYQNALNTGMNQYGQNADRFAQQGNVKSQLAQGNVNQSLQQAGTQASIATGNTGLANQQQQTANQQGNNFMGFMFSDENAKVQIKDLSGGISETSSDSGYDQFKKNGGAFGAIKSFMGGGSGASIGGGTPSGGGQDMAQIATMAAQYAPQILAAFSDKNVKQDTGPKDMSSVIDSMLANVKPVKYKYKKGIETVKPEGTERVGILAQDLEKTPLKDTVIDSPEGKQLDIGQLTANNTAMLLELAKQLKEIQSQLQGNK